MLSFRADINCLVPIKDKSKQAHLVIFGTNRVGRSEEVLYATLVNEEKEIVKGLEVVLPSARTICRNMFQCDEKEDEYHIVHMKQNK